MPKIEQPELESLELTLFSAGQIPRKAGLIVEMARCVGGEANRPFVVRIEKAAVEIIRLARKAVAEQSRYAGMVGYKYSRHGDDSPASALSEGALLNTHKRKGKRRGRAKHN